jgi:ABC-type branched-subunit amino acid transport system ATPase component
MNVEILNVDSLAGPGFSGTCFSVRTGGWVRLAGGPREVCGALVDAIYGIGPCHEGAVLWNGRPLSALGEAGLLALADGMAYVHTGGGLLLNLRIWENLLLPLSHRGTSFNEDELEKEILAAYAIAGFPEADAARILQGRTDDLNTTEIAVTLLVRAHLVRPAMLVCEALFDSLPGDGQHALALLLDWMAERQPGLALLTIGDSRLTLSRMALSAWPEFETLTWKEKSWHVS